MTLLGKSSGRMRNSFAALVSTLALFAGACAKDGAVAPVRPDLPSAPAIPAQYRGAAFIADVSSLRKTIKITPPTATIRNPVAAGSLAGGEAFGRSGIPLGGEGGPQEFGSLLGGDVVDLTATNYLAGALGAVVPGKILITFDLQVSNKLNSVNLIVPTFPTPPSGTTGVLLFPFEIGVTTTSGGVSVGGQGNEVIVTSPRGGAVTVSNDWDGNGTAGSGAPHNFFNDVGCTATANDCYRWEEYGPILALGSSSARKVGFLIDPTVGDFRVKMILAADLINSTGSTQFGTVAGAVTSNVGAIAGASISISGGFSGTTIANGSYSVTNVGVGSRTVSVSNLPAGCTAPASQTVTVANGATSTANFAVVCAVPTGTVAGAVTSSLGGGITGVTVTVTPTGGSPATFITPSTGGYTVTVPVGSGTGAIALTNLPSNCTAPAAASYSGLTSGGTVTQNFTVTCTPPPQFGTLQGTITSSQAAAALAGVTVTITPTGGSALAPLTTNATGQYSSASVPVGGGSFTLGSLPTGCTNPGATPYSGITNGGTVTVNLTITCPPAAVTYPFGAAWGAITTGGPTGRQVTLTFTANMGATDQLVGVQFSMTYNGALLTYASRAFIDPNLDFGAVASPSAGLVNAAVTSSQSLTSGGAVSFLRLTFNIPTGAAGTVASPAVSFVEFLVGTPASNIDEKAKVVVTMPTLIIP